MFGAELEVDAIETELPEAIENRLSSFRQQSLAPVGSKVCDEPVPIDVHCQPGKSVPIFVDETKCGRSSGSGVPTSEAPPPLDRPGESAVQRGVLVENGLAPIARREPRFKLGRQRRGEQTAHASRRMHELDGRRVQHEPDGGRSPVERIASYGGSGVGELHARLMRAARLENQFEHRSIGASSQHLNPRDRQLSASGSLSHDACGTADNLQRVAQYGRALGRGPAPDAGYVGLFHLVRFELRCERCVGFPPTGECHDTTRVAIEALVQPHVGAAEVRAKARDNIVRALGVRGLRRYALRLVCHDKIVILVHDPLGSEVRPHLESVHPTLWMSRAMTHGTN